MYHCSKSKIVPPTTIGSFVKYVGYRVTSSRRRGTMDYGNGYDIEQTPKGFQSDLNKMVDELQEIIEGKKTEKTNAKNPVILDNICKEVILRDKLFRRNWSRKYEHLTGEFFKKVLAEECRKEGFPADTFEREPPEDAIKRSPIPLKPSPSIPRTTSGMVGLRSSRPEYNLEFVGPLYISPKRTIEPLMQPGEFRVTHQRFIFLG